MTPGKWKETVDGWLECEFWKGLSFKFKDGSKQLQRCSSQEPDGDGDGSTIMLQRALQDATNFGVGSGCPSDLLQILAQVLQEADDPVPVLKELHFNCCVSDALRPFLDAAMAQKLVWLTSLEMLFVKDLVGIFPYLTGVIGSGNLPDLSALSMYNCQLDSAAVRSLAACLKRAGGSLRALGLRLNEFGREGHLALAEVMMSGHLLHLENLTLSNTSMDGACCAAYVKAVYSKCLSALKVLVFGGNKIGPERHMALAEALESGQLPCLETLALWKTGMGAACCNAYSTAFSSGRVQALKRLNFEVNEIGPEGHMAFAKALESGQLPSLEGLGLAKTGMDAACCDAYSTAFASGRVPALKFLNFSDNEIGLEGHMALAKALESGQLPCLEALPLPRTGMDAACCNAYCTALVSGRVKAWKGLFFEGNEIGDDGVKALCDAFASRKVNITRLELSHNKIGDEGMKAILQSMEARHLPDLEYLNLDSNEFSEDGYSKLGSALASGTANSLRTLFISGNAEKTRENVLHILEAFSQNKLLVAEVDLEWYKYPDLELQMEELRSRNMKQVQIMKDLGGPGILEVAATRGKVYLCGNPMAGKTTLRKSMQRSLCRALCMRERSTSEERTRGIDVSQLTSQGKDGLSLAVWDMAGQEEYHLVHHVFLRDLSSIGSATSFIIVCRSNSSPITIKEDLEYWLRFIASSSNREIGNPREVFVVLNCIDGRHSMVDIPWWGGVLTDMRERYKDLLAIRKEEYVGDLRKRKSVLNLREQVIECSRETLCGKKIPEICQLLQEKLTLWIKEREEFPVLHWIKFFEKVQKMDRSWSEMIIEAATKYLHEVGVLIYINRNSLLDLHVEHSGKGLVVLDPNWLCREVVGSILLPENITRSGERCLRKEVDENNGSISPKGLHSFFRSKHKEWTALELDDLRVILLRLGLCFQGVGEKLFIPCLIKGDDQSRGECWDPKNLKSRHNHEQWVMGYTVEYEKSDFTVVAPIALWHSFQVDLAQSGAYKNPNFEVGKFFVSFTDKQMAVLIEVILGNFDNPTFDSVNVFVKPLDKIANPTRRAQLDLAHDLINQFLKLWNRVCPAVHNVQRVVWPWPADQPKSNNRSQVVCKFLLDEGSQINEVRRRVQEDGVGAELNLRVGNFMGDSVSITYADLLSSKFLGDAAKSVLDQVKSVQDQVKSSKNQVEKGALVWSAGIQEAIKEGVYPHDVLKEVKIDKYEAPSLTPQDLVATQGFKSTEADQLDQPGLQLILSKLDGIEQTQKSIFDQNKEILKGVRAVHGFLQDAYKELKDVKVKQELLLEKVQDFQKIFLEDKEQSCPRFIYLVEKDAGGAARWTSLQRALLPLVTSHIHFVCEARYDIHGHHGLHVVDNQKGIDIAAMKKWARKLAPWLKIALTALSITAKVAANVVAPGVGSILANAGEMFPGLMQMQRSSLADLLISGIDLSREELDQLMIEGEKPSSTSTLETPQKLCGSTRKYMTDLLRDLSAQHFEEKVALRKVSLQHKGKSDAASVLWICNECYKKYEDSLNITILELDR